jgi:uncharacterized protein
VLVPPAVWSELVDERTAPGAAEIFAQSWLVTEAPDPDLVAALLAELEDQLDLGEAQAIALAKSHKESLLLIDEKLGRRVASEMGQAHAGTLGVLARAKHAGLTPAIRPHIEALGAVGFRLSSVLIAKVLREAGE